MNIRLVPRCPKPLAYLTAEERQCRQDRLHEMTEAELVRARALMQRLDAESIEAVSLEYERIVNAVIRNIEQSLRLSRYDEPAVTANRAARRRRPKLSVVGRNDAKPQPLA